MTPDPSLLTRLGITSRRPQRTQPLRHPALRLTVAAACMVGAGHAGAQITFYEHDGYAGRSFTTQSAVRDFTRYGFNDRASSVVVANDRWEVCQDARHAGRCVVLRPGQYESLAALGLNDRVSSVRRIGAQIRVGDERFAPGPATPYYDARRRPNERLYQADVTLVRAVLGQAERRCWIEREQVSQEHRNNVPAAVAGALIGGILGHQVGGGSGRDLATVGGIVAGAAIGSRAGSGSGDTRLQDVQRCADVSGNGKPAYWDVTYIFRGTEHRVQMARQPGATVTVNRAGEPRT